MAVGLKEKTMNTISFSDVRKVIKKHIEKEKEIRGYRTEIIQDDLNAFRVIIESESRMAEVVVEEPNFAPYRWVKMEVYEVDTESMTYAWYDKNEDTLETILVNIDEGLTKL